MRQEMDEEDLRTEIFNLRKHIARVCSENQILKVKIRKLQEEMIRRDRQLDEFLHSKRFFGFNKSLQDKGASVLLNLKLKNDKLEHLLLEKDLTIKRLQNTLQTAKLYNANSLTKKFASKGTECAIIADNKSEFHKKGKLNTKIELHMPNFDMDNFDGKEENLDVEKEMKINRRNANSVESQFLLDINFDLKQRTKPAFYSEARYESRSASYQMEAKESQSDGKLSRRKLTRDVSPTEEYQAVEDDFRATGQYQFQENHVGEGCLFNPTFRKILQTVEELMANGTTGANFHRKMSADESVQFPSIARSELFQIASLNSKDEDPIGEDNHIPVTQIQKEKSNSKMDNNIDMLDNELPPSILADMHMQDQSDLEGFSISEKIDQMEKNEIVETKKKLELEGPHEEIKQLHVYLMDMISQVDNLKETIFQMKADQEKTENDLKTKDESIDKLAREIEQLREFRSISSTDVEKLSNLSRLNVELPEKDTDSIGPYENIQKATEENIKKIAGKMKHLRDTKSKSSISSQTKEKKSSSSKNSKSEKKKNTEKSSRQKSEKKSQKPPESKKPFGIGNGDVIDVPFYRCGLTKKSCPSELSAKSEFDELD